MQSLRSPRAASNLDKARVEEGRALFSEAHCQGCHGGEKWTVSRRLYTPSVTTHHALSRAPLALTPDSPECGVRSTAALRPVGSLNVAEYGVGIAELRVDMKTQAQGDGNPAGEGRGYNVPSRLGVSTGARSRSTTKRCR